MSGHWVKLKPLHLCDIPNPCIGRYALGSLYRCSECGRLWKISHEGWIRAGWWARLRYRNQ